MDLQALGSEAQVEVGVGHRPDRLGQHTAAPAILVEEGAQPRSDEPARGVVGPQREIVERRQPRERRHPAVVADPGQRDVGLLVGARQIADPGGHRAHAHREGDALGVQAALQGIDAIAQPARIGVRAEHEDRDDLRLAHDDERLGVMQAGARDRRAAHVRGVVVGAGVHGHRGGHQHPRVGGDAMGLAGGEQRSARRHLAGEQVLEQVAALAVGVGHHVLLVLDVGMRGVRAGEVAVAHQGPGERQRRRLTERGLPARTRRPPPRTPAGPRGRR